MGRHELTCAKCGREIAQTEYHRVCPTCGGEPVVAYDLRGARLDRELPGTITLVDPMGSSTILNARLGE